MYRLNLENEVKTNVWLNENSELLKNVFGYFEEIVNENDSNLVNVFSITVLESLGNDKRILETAKQYMGPKLCRCK